METDEMIESENDKIPEVINLSLYHVNIDSESECNFRLMVLVVFH